MVTIESLKENITNGWVTWILVSCATAFVVWALRKLLYVFGKEETVKPEHRKYLYGISSVFVFCVLLFCQNINRQLSDIGASSPMKGKFRAGVLSVFPAGVKQTESTNQMPITMSGISPSTSKVSDAGVDYVMILKIDNSGQPSVAWNWKAALVIQGGSRFEALIPSISIASTSVVSVPTVIGPYYLKMEDHLIQSLAVNPLATGAGKIGWLMIHINGIAEVSPGSHFILTFEDVFGRETKIDHVWTSPPK